MCMTIEARKILGPAANALAQAGISNARQDARLLLGLVLGCAHAVLPHEQLQNWSNDLQIRFQAYLSRRMAGEPVSRIRGWREFWSLDFELSKATLDPRPDSETLVEHAVAFGRVYPAGSMAGRLQILDIGTGSGCLLLSCLSELEMATGIGIDNNSDAIAMAAHNASVLGFENRSAFVLADFTIDLAHLGCFDIILCNPPYVPSAQIANLSPEVALYDPQLALDGGLDGLDSWRLLMPQMLKLLSAHGQVFVEIGDGQSSDVLALASLAGLSNIGIYNDLSGIVRCLSFSRGADHAFQPKMSNG